MNSSIRSKIRPFRHFATYDTGWAKDQTFDDIYAVLAPYAVKLFRKYKAFDNEIPDALQRGFMHFWERLSAEPDMLTTMSKTNAVSIILNRGGINIERRRKMRCDRLEDFSTDSLDYDDYTLTGLEHDRSERWAAWATAADYRIDIERIMTRLAIKYQNMPRFLFALYAVTTEVTIGNAASMLGMERDHFAETCVKPIREEVQREFSAIYEPPKAWIEKYRAGYVAPAKRVLARHQHNLNYTAAIHSLLDEQQPDDAARRFNVHPKTLRFYRTQARKDLASAYGG
jgi:hypothetical protein